MPMIPPCLTLDVPKGATLTFSLHGEMIRLYGPRTVLLPENVSDLLLVRAWGSNRDPQQIRRESPLHTSWEFPLVDRRV